MKKRLALVLLVIVALTALGSTALANDHPARKCWVKYCEV